VTFVSLYYNLLFLRGAHKDYEKHFYCLYSGVDFVGQVYIAADFACILRASRSRGVEGDHHRLHLGGSNPEYRQQWTGSRPNFRMLYDLDLQPDEGSLRLDFPTVR